MAWILNSLAESFRGKQKKINMAAEKIRTFNPVWHKATQPFCSSLANIYCLLSYKNGFWLPDPLLALNMATGVTCLTNWPNFRAVAVNRKKDEKDGYVSDDDYEQFGGEHLI